MSDIWSGAIAFSYFPAESDQGEFGMVTIDGNTVNTNDDFARLKTQYNDVTLPTTPSAPGSTTYPSCPAQNSTFLASTTLPPTPNDNSCNCLEQSLQCRFTPQTNNATQVGLIVGELLDFTCSQLGQFGGSCDAISANGSTGVYGNVSMCSPCTCFILVSLLLRPLAPRCRGRVPVRRGSVLRTFAVRAASPHLHLRISISSD